MLELYQAEDCPHSTEIRETMTELGLSFVAHNPRHADDGGVTNEFVRDQLVAIGGEDQIPLLVETDRGVTVTESEEIVSHLRDQYR